MKPPFGVPSEGGWCTYPLDKDAHFGDSGAVAYFGDDELGALRAANRNGDRAVYVLPGETIAQAADAHAEGSRG